MTWIAAVYASVRKATKSYWLTFALILQGHGPGEGTEYGINEVERQGRLCS